MAEIVIAVVFLGLYCWFVFNIVVILAARVKRFSLTELLLSIAIAAFLLFLITRLGLITIVALSVVTVLALFLAAIRGLFYPN